MHACVYKCIFTGTERERHAGWFSYTFQGDKGTNPKNNFLSQPTVQSMPPLITAGLKTMNIHESLLKVVFFKINLRFLMKISNKWSTKLTKQQHGAKRVNRVNTTLTTSRYRDKIVNFCDCSMKCLDFNKNMEYFFNDSLILSWVYSDSAPNWNETKMSHHG